MRVSRASAKERGYGFVAIKQTNSNRVHGPNDESIYHFFFHYGRAGWHQRSDVNDFDQLNFTLE